MRRSFHVGVAVLAVFEPVEHQYQQDDRDNQDDLALEAQLGSGLGVAALQKGGLVFHAKGTGHQFGTEFVARRPADFVGRFLLSRWRSGPLWPTQARRWWV